MELPNLNCLPVEIYHSVLFSFFDYLDEIWNLRLISKRFWSIVKSYNIKELSFQDFYDFNATCVQYFSQGISIGYSFELKLKFDHSNNWFSTSKSLQLKNHLDASKLGMIKNPTSNLLNLKRLKIVFDSSPIKIKDLNKFSLLEILEYDTNFFCTEKSDRLLQLPNLEALLIKFISFENKDIPEGFKQNSLSVYAPNLHSLSIEFCYRGHYYSGKPPIKNYSANPIENFVELLSVKYLKTTLLYSNIDELKNLEFLDIDDNYFKPDNEIFFKIVSKLNLKKLRFNRLPSHSYEIPDFINGFKNFLEKLEKKIELFVYGIRVSKTLLNSINDILENNKLKGWNNYFDLQLENYCYLDDYLSFFMQIRDYNELIRAFPSKDDEPYDLFDKFKNVQKLIIRSKVEDENRLIGCIKGFSISYLVTKNSSLSQRFYDRLSSELLSLIVKENDEEINFDFIWKMPYLMHLETNLEVRIDERIKNLKNLSRFKYEIKKGTKFSNEAVERTFLIIDIFKNKTYEMCVYEKTEQNHDLYGNAIWIDERFLPTKKDYLDANQIVKWTNCLRNDDHFLLKSRIEKKIYKWFGIHLKNRFIKNLLETKIMPYRVFGFMYYSGEGAEINIGRETVRDLCKKNVGI